MSFDGTSCAATTRLPIESPATRNGTVAVKKSMENETKINQDFTRVVFTRNHLLCFRDLGRPVYKLNFRKTQSSSNRLNTW